MSERESFWDDKFLWYAGKGILYIFIGIAVLWTLLFVYGFMIGLGVIE